MIIILDTNHFMVSMMVTKNKRLILDFYWIDRRYYETENFSWQIHTYATVIE